MTGTASDPAASIFHPLRDNILVRRSQPETATTRGVIIPDICRRSPDLGRVVAVGPGYRTSEGILVPPLVAPGDEVALEHDSGLEVAIAGEKLVVVRERDVLGILSPVVHDGKAVPAPTAADEPVLEPAFEFSADSRQESIETDVSPDLLDHEPVTGEDLH